MGKTIKSFLASLIGVFCAFSILFFGPSNHTLSFNENRIHKASNQDQLLTSITFNELLTPTLDKNEGGGRWTFSNALYKYGSNPTTLMVGTYFNAETPQVGSTLITFKNNAKHPISRVTFNCTLYQANASGGNGSKIRFNNYEFSYGNITNGSTALSREDKTYSVNNQSEPVNIYILAGTYVNNTKRSGYATMFTNFEIKVYYSPAQAVSITAGTGISSVYLSSISNATTGETSGSKFNTGTTVYGFATLKKGYSADPSWTLISGESNTEGAIYQIGSKTVGSSALSFGTISASETNYNITYNLDGGVNNTSNPTSYTINSQSITIQEPTKTGYTFDGWSQNDLTGTEMTPTILSGSIGDREYTANWTPNVYKANFVDTKGTGGLTSLDVTYDSLPPSLTEDQLPTRAEENGHSFSFAGYYTNPPSENEDGSQTPNGKQYYDNLGNGTQVWKETSDTTLYAVWTIDMEVESSGFVGTWDNDPHGIDVKVNFPEGTAIYYGVSKDNCNDTSAFNFLYSDVGTYNVYFEVKKEGYTTYKGKEVITINKNISLISPRPSAIMNLEYTGLDQDLILPGQVDYGNMLYALNTSISYPGDEAFSTDIPKAKTVGDYYVFYKSSGDKNHTAYEYNGADVIKVSIARVDRTEVENLNDIVLRYLETIIDNPEYSSIYNTLNRIREEVVADAIIEDNVTASKVEENYQKLKDALSDAKVAVTESLINAIGKVTYPSSSEAINAANEYFDTILNDEERALVDQSLRNTLEEDTELFDTVDNAASLINDIPSPAASDDYHDKVAAAKENYDNLTPEQKALLDQASDADYEQVLEDNVQASIVIKEISDIGELTYDGGENDSKDDIENAEAAYANLSEEQKALVNEANHDDLVQARQSYDDVEETVRLIESIGDISHGGQDDSKEALEKAREAYNALSEEEQALVINHNDTYKTLEDDEQVYQALVYIDDIGEVTFDSESGERVAAARDFIDSLTDDQKAQLGEKKIQNLVAAEETYSTLQKTGNIWLIILFIFAGLLLISGIIVFFIILKRKRDDDEEDNKINS